MGAYSFGEGEDDAGRSTFASLTGLQDPRSDPTICDDLPEPSDDSPEHDPTDGSATPGSTGSQRLLPSGDDGEPDRPHPDCDEVDDILDQLNRIRDAFRDNPPRPGENGHDYAKRIEGGVFGAGQPGGAESPMGTGEESCVIYGNRSYYDGVAPAIRASDCALEGVHRTTCRWARDNVAGGFRVWGNNPANRRQNELDAYAAGIQELENWKQDNGCNQ